MCSKVRIRLRNPRPIPPPDKWSVAGNGCLAHVKEHGHGDKVTVPLAPLREKKKGAAHSKGTACSMIDECQHHDLRDPLTIWSENTMVPSVGCAGGTQEA